MLNRRTGGRCGPSIFHRMRILFAIFVLCICALLWATYAMTRRIRQHKLDRRSAAEHSRIDGTEGPTSTKGPN